MKAIPPLIERYNDITEHRKDIYCIDIDGTLTEPHHGTPWEAVPKFDRIAYVNQLYDEGATIYLMTARGFIHASKNIEDALQIQIEQDKHARERTEAQLKKWGVKYHALFFGKPRAAVYVDDRGVNDEDFFHES
tara:strand:- start:112 stop:513 length:402 start_codon:yes stop_codon:yes gene_type:complete